MESLTSAGEPETLERLLRLSREDTQHLLKNTGFTKKQINRWFKEFVKDNPEGKLSIEKVYGMMKNVLPDENGRVLVNLIFSNFDQDKDSFLRKDL